MNKIGDIRDPKSFAYNKLGEIDDIRDLLSNMEVILMKVANQILHLEEGDDIDKFYSNTINFETLESIKFGIMEGLKNLSKNKIDENL